MRAPNQIKSVLGQIKTGVMGALDNLKTTSVNAELRAKAAYSAAKARTNSFAIENEADYGRILSAYRNVGMSSEGAMSALNSEFANAGGARRINMGLYNRVKTSLSDARGQGGYDAWRVGMLGAGAISTGAVAAIGYNALKD